MKPVVLSCKGPALSEEERAFFARENPFGLILFKRNCASPAQISDLIASFRAVVGRADAFVAIDQEGGRVARLGPPHWPAMPPLRKLGALYEKDPQAGLEAAKIHTSLIAGMLLSLGFSADCAPVCDLFLPETSRAIGDRALSPDPEVVAAMAATIIETFLSHGLMPIMKHLPGHGRVLVDPHETLPFVEAPRDLLEETDFLPFRKLADAPAGMNCHVVFKALDPARPVSLSPTVQRDIIRGALGFDGLLFSDDLHMGAISLPLAERGNAALEAGADLLFYCSDDLAQNEAFCAELPSALSQSAWDRLKKAEARLSKAPAICQDPAAGLARLAFLLGDNA